MRAKKTRRYPRSLILALLGCCGWRQGVRIAEARSAAFSCTDDSDCEQQVGKGSQCLLMDDGNEEQVLCSNPYASGCFFHHNDTTQENERRVCNSEDPLDDATGRPRDCRRDTDDNEAAAAAAAASNKELRIFGPNWETGIVQAWLLQILLSEFLDVPTTIETGSRLDDENDTAGNFYSSVSSFGTTREETTYSDHFEALQNAFTAGDCRRTVNSTVCAHVAPEVWDLQRADMLSQLGQVNQVPSGFVGDRGWFVTKFTAERDPTVASYLGLQGEENRRKLAEMFLRPTTWKDYCALVSIDNCATPDEASKRAPGNDDEGQRMFVEGLYTGHFRRTTENDCDRYPTTCTGHIADFPCGWISYVTAQTVHNDIALTSSGSEPSGGYTMAQLVEIWLAANATRSNVIMPWWSPEPTFYRFQGTEAEFTRVTLPPVTQVCLENRVPLEESCSANATIRAGNPLGACDEDKYILQNLLVDNLERNRAYEAISSFSISTAQLSEILAEWSTAKTPREAICSWAVNHREFFEALLPPTTMPTYSPTHSPTQTPTVDVPSPTDTPSSSRPADGHIISALLVVLLGTAWLLLLC